MKEKKQFKVGQLVTSHLISSPGSKKIKVTAKVKEVKIGFGKTYYILTKGKIEDFATRFIA